MVDSYVTKAQLENNKIVLTVQVGDFKPGEAVEISGQATQNNAAFAPFYEIKDTPGTNTGAGSTAYPNGNSSLTVTADPVDAEKFKAGEDITVVVRVAKVWVTVLSKDRDNLDPTNIAWTASKTATVEADPKKLAGRPAR